MECPTHNSPLLDIELTAARQHLARLDVDIAHVAEVLQALRSNWASIWNMPDDVIDEFEELSGQLSILEQLKQREKERLYALDGGVILCFSNEINMEEFAPILSPLECSPFELKEDVRKKSKKEIYATLESLPFLDSKDLYPRRDSDSLILRIQGPLMFPVSRIIGVNSFLSWAGRGLFPDNDNPDYSLEKIINFAQSPEDVFHDARGGANIEVVRDNDGLFWGIADTDGSHRVAAAKLRQDRYIHVMSVTIPHNNGMGILR